MTPSGGPRLPDFVIIGAQKAATTTLWHVLRQHPQLFLPDGKELNYFVRHNPTVRTLNWYQRQFEAAPAGAILGEASPTYTMSPLFGGAAPHMAEVIPEARLIYLVREPFARMRSAYAQLRADGVELRPIGEALLHELHYSTTSCYAMQLEQYLQHYPADRVLVMRSEDLDADPERGVNQVLRFLGADPDWTPAGGFARQNQTATKLVPRRKAVRGAHVLRRLHLSRNRSALVAPPQWLRRPFDSEELTLPDEVIENFTPIFERDASRFLELTGVSPVRFTA